MRKGSRPQMQLESRWYTLLSSLLFGEVRAHWCIPGTHWNGTEQAESLRLKQDPRGPLLYRKKSGGTQAGGGAPLESILSCDICWQRRSKGSPNLNAGAIVMHPRTTSVMDSCFSTGFLLGPSRYRFVFQQKLPAQSLDRSRCLKVVKRKDPLQDKYRIKVLKE